MRAYKTKTDLEKLRKIINIPEEIHSKEVEIIILSEENQQNDEEKHNDILHLAGALKEYAKPVLIGHETAIALEKAMQEKYDLH